MQSHLPATPKEALHQLQLLFFGMVAGVLLFSVTLIFLKQTRAMPPVVTDKSVINILFIAMLLTVAACVSLAVFFYRKKLKALQQGDSVLMEKFNTYRPALALFLVLNEVPACLSMILYLLTGAAHFLVIAGILWVNMILKYPAKSKIFNELQLNTAEQMELN
jgi:hypothetical protein